MNDLVAFSDGDISSILNAADARTLDGLDFGVIGFDAECVVRVYNHFESVAAGLDRSRVIGRQLFTDVAPCMNNFMVAQRFVEAFASGVALDATIDYVLTLRMKPTRVSLRLVALPGATLAFVLVERRAAR